jgi:hypothetical protein
MKRWLLAALGAISLVTSCGVASAQIGGDPLEHPIAIRLGALWPTDGTVRNATSDTWFNIGLDYILTRTEDGNDWIAAIDYAVQDDVNYWAIQGLYKWFNSGGSSPANFSFGLGLGVYFFDPDNGNAQTEIGIPLVADWEFTPRLFLEGKYHWVASDVTGNALTLQLGYRF